MAAAAGQEAGGQPEGSGEAAAAAGQGQLETCLAHGSQRACLIEDLGGVLDQWAGGAERGRRGLQQAGAFWGVLVKTTVAYPYEAEATAAQLFAQSTADGPKWMVFYPGGSTLDVTLNGAAVLPRPKSPPPAPRPPPP